MSLFEVPGWSTSTVPVHEQSKKAPRKHKRSKPRDKGHVPTIERDPEAGVGDISRRKRKAEQGSTEQEDVQSISLPSRNAKRRRKEKTLPAVSPKKGVPDTSPALTALQRTMKESLGGARFRLVNESLYKSDSHQARSMMQQDPRIFEEYHLGFRHQVLSWPTNPVDYYISKFSSYPPTTIISDLGCGDAVLAKSLLSKGLSVISFDLVSDNKFVVEADICERIPLPGSEGGLSEKSAGEGQIVDVVVCALSLMGTNWVNCLREAWRVLKAGGQLHIAEVTSRFTNVEDFISLVGSIGFHLKSRDDSNTHFMLFAFVKAERIARSDKEWAKLVAKGNVLKPCEYKRR